MTLNRLEVIRTRLEAAFSPTYLQVLDESDQHVGHAGHQGGGRHFAIIIAADCFAGVSRVAAHRQIYALFDDMIPEQIHALRIVVTPAPPRAK
jgi:BolA protein